MLPEIIKQVGPQQYDALKGMMGELAKNMPGQQAADDDEDDVPPLVGTFEDAAAKKWIEQKPWVEIWNAEIVRGGAKPGL